jgi:F0F1-type ATP synthase assembly protein I
MGVLDSPRLEMAQAPEHSGNLSQDAELDRTLAPAARKTRAYYETLSFSSAGIELGLSVVIGALFGRWLDGEAGTTPAFMIVLTVIGFAAGVRAVVRAGKKANRKAEASK